MKIVIIVIGLLLGLGVGYFLFYHLPQQTAATATQSLKEQSERGEVIGFLPFALLSRAQHDYSDSITTLAYFALTIDTDGTILRLNNPREAEPGWHALHSGAVEPFLTAARQKDVRRSLVMFLGDNGKIDMLLSDPVANAHNMTADVLPVMKQYGFQDLNIDIESTKEASSAARRAFTTFLATIKEDMKETNAGSLTVDVSTLDVVRQDLIDPRTIAPIADRVVLMAYDFHSPASTVTGAVSPLHGAGTEAEYDTSTALRKTLALIPKQKLILGLPTYGYEWETITASHHAAIIPGTGVVLSSKRAEETISGCTKCQTTYDPTAQEVGTVYFDSDTGAYRQLYYPDKRSTEAKIDFVRRENLPGIAVWALGYEGKDIMVPLKNYRQ